LDMNQKKYDQGNLKQEENFNSFAQQEVVLDDKETPSQVKYLLQELQKSNRLNEILLDAIPHPALLVRKDRTVIAANKIAKETGALIGGFCWRDWGHCLYISAKDKKRLDSYKAGEDKNICCYFCEGDKALQVNEQVNIKIELGDTFWDVYWVPTEEKDVYLHYAIDITEQKRIESDLRASELRFKQLTEASFEGICLHSNGIIIDCNKRMETMFGYEAGSLIGMPISNLLTLGFEDPSDNKKDTQGINQYYGVKKDGTVFEVEILTNSTVYKQKKAKVLVVRDISISKNLEESYIKAKNMLAHAQSIAHIGNINVDIKNNNVYWSDEIFRILGYQPQEFQPDINLHFRHIHRDDRKLLLRKIADKTILDSTFEHECRFIKRTGSGGWLRIKGDIDYDKKTLKRTRIFAVIQDITEKKQAELLKNENEKNIKLLRQEKQYREIIDLAPLIILFNYKGRIKYINKTGVKKLGGIDKNQFIDRRLDEFLTYNDEMTNCDGVIKRLDGTSFEFSAVSSPVIFEGKEMVQLIISDVTERNLKEQKNRVNEKMVSIGLMASGIAHEINQPLNSLKVMVDGMLYLAETGIYNVDPVMVDKLNKMSQQINSIDRIIKYLYSLMRTKQELISCNLHEIIDGLIQQHISKGALKDICIIKKYGDIPPVKATPIGLYQAINNIVTNAISALENTEPNKEICFCTKPFDNIVILEISNNGPAIREDLKDKIFDPFFTTKEPGKGSGLGLSLSHTSIKAMGGDLYLDSTGTVGTKFVIELQADNSETEPEE